MKKATELIHTGERTTAGATVSLTMPIYETSTFIFESAAAVAEYQAGKLDAYLYSRYENPTVVAVEQKLAAVEGAEASLLSARAWRPRRMRCSPSSGAATRSCAARPSTAVPTI
jgi:O-acetylhomoserine/O-acetylserine sulfhydrylase-like pyridoxal-dependent enzyme